MKNFLFITILFCFFTFGLRGQLWPDATAPGFTFYKPQPQLTLLKGVSSPVSHPDFDWFEPETFIPAAGSGLEFPSYRVFSLNGAILSSDVEVLSFSTDGLSERKVGTSIQKEVVKGIRVSTDKNLKPITFPLSGVKDIKFIVGIPSAFAKESLGMTINLKVQVKTKGNIVKEVKLQLQLNPGGGNPGI